MEELFTKILDDDEKIVKIIRPNKFKFYMSFFIKSSLCLVWFAIIGVLAILFPDEGVTVSNKAYALIPIGVYVIVELFIMFFAYLYYKTLYYAYTNKRLIIRSGVFGVDFRSLDMGMVGAIDVYVSLLDKLTGKDTGAVCFGSTASPMISMYGGSFYRFNHIEKPYETCKEIKLAIDTYKKQASQGANGLTTDKTDEKKEIVENEIKNNEVE